MGIRVLQLKHSGLCAFILGPQLVILFMEVLETWEDGAKVSGSLWDFFLSFYLCDILLHQRPRISRVKWAMNHLKPWAKTHPYSLASVRHSVIQQQVKLLITLGSNSDTREETQGFQFTETLSLGAGPSLCTPTYQTQACLSQSILQGPLCSRV